MTNYRAFAALLGAALLSSCDKDAVQQLTGPVPGSQIKFFNFGVNAPAVNFYANDVKITAITSATGTEATTGTVYGSAGASGLYSAIEPGQYTLKGKITATVDKDLAISTVTSTLENGKFYSFFMSGFYNTATKTVEGFVTEDPVPATFDFSQAYVRFVNAISNSSPMTLYIKTATTSEAAIGSAVSYKSAGTFVAVPPAVYDLTTRVGAATTAAITRTSVSFSAGKVYTIAARGDMTVTSTTATNRPFLDNTANR
jgi:uncharacterized protein DUF4397